LIRGYDLFDLLRGVLIDSLGVPRWQGR
jgi:hypothetical protein